MLYEPMRREILRILAKEPMSQTQLSKLLDLRTPTVGHHLSLLKAYGFVQVVRQEPGKHGIVEKFYESTAQLFFIDRKNMPTDIRRYYMPVDIERVRGVLACLSANRKEFDPSSAFMERFAISLANNISSLATKFETLAVDNDPECFVVRLYSEALGKSVRTDFGEIRSLLYHE